MAQSFMIYSILSVVTLIFSGFLIDKFTSRKIFHLHEYSFIFCINCISFTFDKPFTSFVFFGLIGITNGLDVMFLDRHSWAEIYGVKYIGSIKALTTGSLMVFATAFGTAIFGILIDLGFSIEQISASFCSTYISISIIICCYFIRKNYKPVLQI